MARHSHGGHHRPHGHGHDHDHDHGRGHDRGDHAGRPPGHSGHAHAADAGQRRLGIAFAVLFTFTLLEAGGGWWANSIALLAEAAHMFADSGSLLLAILAIRMARRPARADRTYGHGRYQTLAAYTNGLLLLALTLAVTIAAARRLVAPPPVDGVVMLVTSVAGAAANFGAYLALAGATSLNERSARLHVLGDLAGSGAAVGAACLILKLSWLAADPLLSFAVSALILRSGWRLVRESAHVLLEGTPPGFDAQAVKHELNALPGVHGIHHVHAWSLTGETPIVTLHAELDAGADRERTLGALTERLRQRFGVEHATVQIEEGGCTGSTGEDDCHEPAAGDTRLAR